MTFEHVRLPGAGTPLLLLHGTGGDEHDLLPLRDHLAPGAPVLSPRGRVSENGANRFFRRLAEGVLDEDDLRARVDELADFVLGVDAGPWVAAGFSNGANTASALLFRRPEVLSAAVLLAAMVPFRDGPGSVDLTGKRVAVSNGRRDPLVSAAETATLVAQLRGCGAEVEEFPHDGGHGIDAAVLPELKAFLDR
ncbi:alpha/beta hydrolase [Pseudonocardia petroleophila]|uniref:Alpha/beta hydrolase n=1 Tax=Pseudonocardia petroleophila TaxID=37331 RepID=A0A7G7MDC6_9PSEU|nr:alpha/beta hydrolase [Pseudonocardia petroleophila]QNG50787.1 alpha/beta hydrolase [Pseudonocardia petroleophila]